MALNELILPEGSPASAFLVGWTLPGENSAWTIEDSLDELSELARTDGLVETGRAYQRLSAVNPAMLLGHGKLDEIRQQAASCSAGTVIFDGELEPSQQKNLENFFGDNFQVLDRTALILDIFARHARTREGQLQVQLAQYQYRLPRLTRMWTHLARQAGGRRGGVGLRGPGETQLEIDRRRIRTKIAHLKKEIAQVSLHREQQREKRRRNNIPVIAIVGYTNAGKSTLLNRLSDAGVLAENRLFSTLDPTTRRVKLPSGRMVLFSDTVGLIKKLPHDLVAAFRATFEEIREADLVLHCADVMHPQAHIQREIVEKELDSSFEGHRRVMLVWNKADALCENARSTIHPVDGQFLVSAKTGEGIPGLLAGIESALSDIQVPVELLIPYDQGALLSALYTTGTIGKISEEENGTRVSGFVPQDLLERIGKYRV